MYEMNQQLMDQKRRVDFNTYDISLKELISMVEDDLINIAPDYQRQFRWGDERQSLLIESLFLGIPIPNLFMATNADGTWELIDGVQRVGSILRYMGSKEVIEKINATNLTNLRLQGLEKLTAFNDYLFEDLPFDIQNKFKLTSIKVTTLSDKSDMSVRFDLFERLNRGGVILSDQEIRACVYRGGFNDFIKELARDKSFVQCVHISENKEKSGLREELVLRFFAYLYDIDNFSHSVKEFLNKYMEKADKKFSYSKNEQLFREVFEILSKALPDGINKGRKNTPLNLYEAISVGAAKVLLEKGTINTEGIQEWMNDEELMAYITGATNTKSNVVKRIEYCEKKFRRN